MYYFFSCVAMLFQFWIIVATIAYIVMIKEYTLGTRELSVFPIVNILLSIIYYLLEVASRTKEVGFGPVLYNILLYASLVDLLIWVILMIRSANLIRRNR